MKIKKLKVNTKSQKYPILIDQEGGRVNRLKNIIACENLTSEFFGNKYKKKRAAIGCSLGFLRPDPCLPLVMGAILGSQC